MRFVFLAAAFLALPLTAGAQSSDAWQWSGNVGDDRWIRVASLNGPMTVVASTDGRVHVTAEKRWTRGDPGQVRFDVVERGGNVTICALWHANSTCTEQGMSSRGSTRNDRNNDVEVHFRVAVPQHVRVAPTTVNGAITVNAPAREVRATTVNGAIEIGTRGGPVTATTVNGGIRASVASIAPAGMKFTTVNGGIDVAIPRDASADVRLSSVNGGITTEFPLTIEGRLGPRAARGTIGGGGPQIEMTTVNGAVALKRL